MTTPSLRDELGLRPDPEFDLELPPGWSRREPDAETEQLMLGSLKQRLMQAHRPDAYGQLKQLLEESFEAMRRNQVLAYFSATDPGEDTLFLPASLNASIRSAAGGESLDDTVRVMVREHGATPLLGDKRTLRVEREKLVRMGAETVVNHSVVYLTPVPGARRRRALQLVAGFGRAPDAPADDEMMTATRLLFDVMVSSLRWRMPEPS